MLAYYYYFSLSFSLEPTILFFLSSKPTTEGRKEEDSHIVSVLTLLLFLPSPLPPFPLSLKDAKLNKKKQQGGGGEEEAEGGGLGVPGFLYQMGFKGHRQRAEERRGRRREALRKLKERVR